jgi:hypothetical protein
MQLAILGIWSKSVVDVVDMDMVYVARFDIRSRFLPTTSLAIPYELNSNFAGSRRWDI